MVRHAVLGILLGLGVTALLHWSVPLEVFHLQTGPMAVRQVRHIGGLHRQPVVTVSSGQAGSLSSMYSLSQQSPLASTALTSTYRSEDPSLSSAGSVDRLGIWRGSWIPLAAIAAALGYWRGMLDRRCKAGGVHPVEDVQYIALMPFYSDFVKGPFRDRPRRTKKKKHKKSMDELTENLDEDTKSGIMSLSEQSEFTKEIQREFAEMAEERRQMIANGGKWVWKKPNVGPGQPANYIEVETDDKTDRGRWTKDERQAFIDKKFGVERPSGNQNSNNEKAKGKRS